MANSLDESLSGDMEHLISKLVSWESSMRAMSTDFETNVNHNENKVDKLVRLLQEYQKSKESRSSSKHPQQQKAVQPAVISKEWLKLAKESIFKNHLMKNLQLSFHNIGSPQLKLCFLSFAIFPENSIIKKRSLIYWWIGEGLVFKRGDKTAEQVGEEIYDKLIKQGLIEPDDNDQSPTINRCKMHPWIHYMLISLAQEAGFFYFNSKDKTSPEVLRKFPFSSSRLHILRRAKSVPDLEEIKDVSTVFNADQTYLSLRPQWLLNMKKLAVLQLGRWLPWSKYHIEVDDQRFLEDLGVHHKHLKFLSLRGISRIRTLPDTIVQLVSLEILDLQACHNLENLPEDIASLRKLTHLNISECYFMESVPKGTERLSSLQVLKGFVIRTKRGNHCKISDLSKLSNLRRLSIYIGRAVTIPDKEFESLTKCTSLCSLTISFGVALPELPYQILPRELEKLELIGMQVKSMPKWLNPSKLKHVKKLYIIGGELASLNDLQQSDQWSVEILRLKYLKNLKIGKVEDVTKHFPRLQYFEKINHADNNNDMRWYKSREIKKGL